MAPYARCLALALALAPVAVRAQAPADTAWHGVGFRPDFATPIGPGLIIPRGTWRAGAPNWAHRTAVFQFDSAIGRSLAVQHDGAPREHLLRTLANQPVKGDTLGAVRRGLFGLSANTADIRFDGTLRLEISTSRQRNLACTPLLAQDPSSGCTGGFTAPSIDNWVQLTSTGVVAQRLHINIDLDTKRDLGNANIIHGYYLGLEDEKLRRVDIGSVQLQVPQSRFLTASIPRNNFGISALAEFGPLTVQAIAATQKGSTVKTKTFNIGDRTTTSSDITSRDLDFQGGRFFWVVNPQAIPGYPSLDILNASALQVPADQRPANVRIYRYVAANAAAGSNANYDGITALGLNNEPGGAPERAGPLRWRLLTAGKDYYIDPSGLWFALTNRIEASDYLAVSYTTPGGATVGTFPATDDPARSDTLRLIRVPNRAPGSVVFAYEMRQVYRIAGETMLRPSLRVSITVGNSERPASGLGSYLSVLGLAVPSDQGIIDTDNRIFPRVRDGGAAQVIRDAFLVFPSAQPFGSPALSLEERNDSLYRTPEYLLFTQGPAAKFILRYRFDAAGGANNSSVDLDALQISQGSDHIEVNGITIKRDVDYTIDYETGHVNFLNPASLFGTGTAVVSATFEQRGTFAVAPTSIAGLTATMRAGRFGTVNFAGLYQAEATAFNRPPLGFEPKASLMAGMTTDLAFGLPGLTRLVNHLVPRQTTAPSLLTLMAEIAMSRPQSNRSGDASLEDFESDGGIQLPVGEAAWLPGSRPQSGAGLSALGIGGVVDTADAVQLVWQNLIDDGHGSSVKLSPHDIDTTIVLSNTTTTPIETVLYMDFEPDTAGGQVDFARKMHWTLPARPGHARWRSMTTPLSLNGVDLSRNDYLEFWVFETDARPIEASAMRLVFDLGRVSEDAVSFAPRAFTVSGTDTTWTGRQFIGTGRLDTEKSTFGTWSGVTDDVGILGDRPDSVIGPGGVVIRNPNLCRRSLSAQVLVFPWGDLGARCSNGNGTADTEDLDADLILDAQGSNEDVFRYVVDLRDTLKYKVRDHRVISAGGVGQTWTLYRVPLHSPDDTIGQPDIRLVKQLRMTLVTPAGDAGPESEVKFGLAMMRLTGSAWYQRAQAPIAGLSGATAQFHGQVVAGSISTKDLQLGYFSPPGIGNASNAITPTQSQFAQQINEKSLRIVAHDIRPGERAEAYNHQLSGSQSLLAYRELRVWARGSGPGWETNQLQAYVKLGSDANNFYLYRANAHTTTWDPEMVIDLDTWKELRTEIENERLLNPTTPTGYDQCGRVTDPTAWAACTPDGHYLVQVKDPQINPPNLAAVQELSAGMYYNGTIGTSIPVTELWIDDIRVGQPLSQTGFAGAVNAHIAAADVGTFDVAYVNQNGQFRQFGQAPSYQDTRTISTATVLHLERFLPTKLGVGIPFTLSINSGRADPELILGTDVTASSLAGLRRPRNNSTTWGVSIRRVLRAARPGLTRFLLDPLTFSASGSDATAFTTLSSATSSNWNVNFGYLLTNERHGRPLGLSKVVRGLPGWFRNSEAGRGMSSGTLALAPTRFAVTSSLSHSMGEFTSFQVPIERLSDTILKPLLTEQHLWRNGAGLTWQPIGMLVASSDWGSTRDLRQYPDSTSIGRLVGESRRGFLGADVGVERDRNVSNVLTLMPRVASWLHPRVQFTTNFILSRSLTSRNPVRIDGDTAGAYILPQTLNNSRQFELDLPIDPQLLLRRIFGDSSGVARITRNLRPIQIGRTRTMESTYDLATFNPGLDYQLALGGFDGFLTHDGQRAVVALDAVTTRVSATFDLPGGLSTSATYLADNLDRYQQQGQEGFLTTTSRSTEWPSGSLAWQHVFTKSFLVLVAPTISITDRKTDAESPLANGGGSHDISDTRSVRPDIQMTFRNGMALRAGGSVDRGSRTSGGNISQNNSDAINGSVIWNVKLPRSLSKGRRQLTAQLLGSRFTSFACIQRSADSVCTPYADNRHTDVRASFSTLLRNAVMGGLQFGWALNDDRSLQQKRSILTLSVSFTMPLSAVGM